ncbi:hypothetical protein ACQ4WX_18990 [Streptomyces lasalocidi]
MPITPMCDRPRHPHDGQIAAGRPLTRPDQHPRRSPPLHTIGGKP